MALINKDGKVTQVVKRQETFDLDGLSKRWQIMYSVETSGWILYRNTSNYPEIASYPSFGQAYKNCQELSSIYTHTDWKVEPSRPPSPPSLPSAPCTVNSRWNSIKHLSCSPEQRPPRPNHTCHILSLTIPSL